MAEEHLYVRYANGEEELYNLAADPYQRRNAARGNSTVERHLTGRERGRSRSGRRVVGALGESPRLRAGRSST